MRLIDADAIGEPWKIVINNRNVVDRSVYLANDIDNAATIEAVPVVHGKWEEYDDGYDTVFVCSKCKSEFVLIDGSPLENDYKYCPNCGAKMDGE